MASYIVILITVLVCPLKQKMYYIEENSVTSIGYIFWSMLVIQGLHIVIRIYNFYIEAVQRGAARFTVHYLLLNRLKCLKYAGEA